MNTKKVIQKLEDFVKARTPEYVHSNKPKFDEKLLKAHYLLAKLYARDKDTMTHAHVNLQYAENEFRNMCLVRTKQPAYISGDLEEFKIFIEQRTKTEKELESYKNKLLKIAQKIEYDLDMILVIPTSANPKNNISKMIEDYFA